MAGHALDAPESGRRVGGVLHEAVPDGAGLKEDAGLSCEYGWRIW
jgi:hypothetical protein